MSVTSSNIQQKAHHILLMGSNGPVGMYTPKVFMSICSVTVNVEQHSADVHVILFYDDI